MITAGCAWAGASCGGLHVPSFKALGACHCRVVGDAQDEFLNVQHPVPGSPVSSGATRERWALLHASSWFAISATPYLMRWASDDMER